MINNPQKKLDITVVTVLITATLFGLVFLSTTSSAQQKTINPDPVMLLVDSNGAPKLPNNFRMWEFLGTFAGLAPDKNSSHEIHSVYASPGTTEYYRKTGEYPDGAVIVKEVLETGTENMTTGRISYATKPKGWFVWIKDQKQRFPKNKLWGDGWGWAFYEAGDKPKLTTTDYKTDCLGCHIPAKATDYSYVQGYPVLKNK